LDGNDKHTWIYVGLVNESVDGDNTCRERRKRE